MDGWDKLREKKRNLDIRKFLSRPIENISKMQQNMTGKGGTCVKYRGRLRETYELSSGKREGDKNRWWSAVIYLHSVNNRIIWRTEVKAVDSLYRDIGKWR